MSYALNEIEALSKKAARGAGLSWGMAEEAAQATRWLVSNGLPGPEVLADLLAQTDGADRGQLAPVSLDGTWRSSSGVLCPLAVGAALSDCADRLRDGPIEMENVSHSLLVVPFVAWAALHLGANLSLNWRGASIGTDGCAAWVDDPEQEMGEASPRALTCVRTTEKAEATTTPALRGTVGPDVWKCLNAFAHRTYAPATEASRLLGAGAGVSDND